MLKEALKIIEEQAFDQGLKDRVKKLGGDIKKLKNKTTREQLVKSIEKIATQVEKHFNDPESKEYFNREWKQRLKDLEQQYQKEYKAQRSDYDSREAYEHDDPKHPDFSEREPRKMNESASSASTLPGAIKKLDRMLIDMKDHIKWERNEEFEMMKPESKKDHEKEIGYYQQQIDKLTSIIKQLKSVQVSNSPVNESEMGISDDLAAKKIFEKIKGTPGLTRPRIEQYVTKYIGMVGKKQSDVKYLTALVISLLDDAGMLG